MNENIQLASLSLPGRALEKTLNSGAYNPLLPRLEFWIDGLWSEASRMCRAVPD